MAANHMVSFKKRSIKAFWRLNGLMIALVCLVTAGSGLIRGIYFTPNMPAVGHLVNGVILLLTITAIVRIAQRLWRFDAEEQAIAGLLVNIGTAPADSLDWEHLAAGMAPHSLIARRIVQMKILGQRHVKPDQATMAAQLLSEDEGSLSFFRFVNNVMALAGILGFFLALAMTLPGTSDLIVVQGLAVALAMSFTALICYLVHRYLFGLMVDIKMAAAQAVEHITAIYLSSLTDN